MRKRLICGALFDGLEATARRGWTVVVDGERIAFAGPSAEAPAPEPGEAEVDHGGAFVMPGLIDIHVHLSYGDGQANEDIDMYATPEFRALRGLRAAQTVLRAGYTSIADPASTGRCAAGIRDAIEGGLFQGPRITASGRQVTSRQGLGDWYPTWIGVPDSSVGVLVRSTDEAVEEIRTQVKDRVDFIKIALDGLHARAPGGELMACFNQREMDAMVEESHRLGRQVVVHARGREAVLVSARAGADVIFHAFDMDEEALDAVVESGAALSPALTFMLNTIEFTRPGDPCHRWRPGMNRRVVDDACRMLVKAREAGVPFMVGTDSGFAVTPYGEWHAREIEIMVESLGFSPGEALVATTSGNTGLLRQGDQVGRLAEGAYADLTVVRGDPLRDVRVLQRADAIEAVYLGGRPVDLARPEPARRFPWEHSFRQWNDVYTRERVAELA